MTLKTTDLKDMARLLQAGQIDTVRHILSTSNDPRAVTLLAKLDTRFPIQSTVTPEPDDEVTEIKQLILQKRFAEAETKARYVIEKASPKTLSAKANGGAKARLQQSSILKSISVMLNRFKRKVKRLILYGHL